MKWTLAAALTTLTAMPALAHEGAGWQHGFLGGLAHPLGGADHMLAMMTVGLWAALAGGARIWHWPTAFVAFMLAGALAGISGLALPLAEPAIMASVVALGLATLFALRLPSSFGAALIGAFGIIHGYAHGIEGAGGNLFYFAGFALATTGLHVTGLMAGLSAMARRRPVLVRAAGGMTALAGLALAFGG